MIQTISVIQTVAGQFLAVEGRKGGNGFELLHYLDLPQPEGGITPEWLKNIWQKGHFETDRVIFLLSPEMVSYKTLQLPQLPEEQLAAAVRLEYEAKHEIYRILEEKKTDQGMVVKTANVDADQLTAMVQSLEAAGLKVVWSGLRFRGLHIYLNFHRDFIVNDEYQLYLDILEEETEIGLVNAVDVLFRRDIGLGARHFQNDPSDWTDDFLEELRLSLVAIARAAGTVPPRLGLFGEVDLESLPLHRIRDELHIECYLPEKTRLTGTFSGNHTPKLAALIGLAMDELDWDPRPGLRFQTVEQVRQDAARERLKFFWKIGGMVALIIFGIMFWAQSGAVKAAKDDAWITENLTKIRHLNQLNQAAQKNMATINSLEAWLKGRMLNWNFYESF